MKPDAETIELLRNIQTEIGAGMVIFPKNDLERAHNSACDRANKIIQQYREGYGLFQMTRKKAAIQSPVTSEAQPEKDAQG